MMNPKALQHIKQILEGMEELYPTVLHLNFILRTVPLSVPIKM